jgi:hypothetical protein
MCAMREIHSGNVHANLKEPLKYLLTLAGGPNGGIYFSIAIHNDLST